MRVDILGPGLMGANLGTIFARTGPDVVFSHANGVAHSNSGGSNKYHCSAGGRFTGQATR